MRVAPTSTWLSRTVLGRNLDHVFPINADPTRTLGFGLTIVLRPLMLALWI
jgi:hypothetical protein